ncbi:hypothetical protein L7P61_18230 [Aeromonas veronii bv. sobria]|uniref:hypothetical protein n=1 Tax=Aeromonas veronii TaxID=654 RepID=UPI000E1EA713|nr:hypothetical protein [Aeromonas veronii]RDU81000.1 hypothetical protein CGZ72_17840 [Aeromonas veronii]TYD41054.1 hypothetical protein CJF23_18360 [Aeromonas veronii]
MDELTVNDLGVDSALDLAVSREALTKSIEKEITAVKLSDESATDLAEVRERLIKELEKQGPVIDYAKELSEQQLALIDSLKRQTQSAESVAKANDEQASNITKQTAGIVKVSNQSTQQLTKQSTLLGNIAGKALQSFTGSIADTLSGVLDDLPGIQQAKQVSSFTKSVMPTKAKEKPAKRIQSVSKRERMKPANIAPEKPQNAPESFTDAFKRRDEQGAGRNSRLMLKHLEEIDKTTGLILKEVKSSTIIGFAMKAMMMSAVVGLGKLLTGLPASLAASLAKTIASKFPSPSSGKTDPKKADPKADPKKSEKTKPQPEPAKTDPKKADPTKQPETAKTDPKPKTETKPQPKPEPAAKTDIPKTEPAKPTTRPKPTTPNPANEAGKITKAGGKVSGMFEKAGKGLSRVAKGIPFLGTALFAADVVQKQMNDPRDAGLSHAQAIMAGEQDNYKGTYQPKPEPMKMERAEPPLSAEGEKLDAKAEKERQEEKKEAMKTQALMAQAVHSTATNIQSTTVNNISGGSGRGSYVHPFGNEYQTPHQKGSMIQR